MKLITFLQSEKCSSGEKISSFISSILQSLVGSLQSDWLRGPFSWISQSNGTSDKVVLFSKSECSKREFVFMSSHLPLIPFSDFRSRFSVNGTDLCKR